MYETNQRSLYQGYDPEGESIESLAKRLVANQQMVSSTIQDIREIGNEIALAQSKITQTASEIRQEVYARIETGEGEILGEVQSLISQTAESITLIVGGKVGKDEIISMINQTPESITISANKIDLQGKVTFSMLDSSTQSTINNKVSTGTLGSLAYQSLVEQAQLGTTIIQGGYIRSELITASRITTGEMSANRIVGGTIRGASLRLSDSAIGALFTAYGMAGAQLSGDNIRLIADQNLELLGNVTINGGTVLSSTSGTAYDSARLGGVSASSYSRTNHTHGTNSAGGHSHGGSTGNGGAHGHGIPNGTVLRTADGGTVTFAHAWEHTHTISSDGSHSHSVT